MVCPADVTVFPLTFFFFPLTFKNIKIHVNLTVLLFTLSLYSEVCQLYLNKAVENNPQHLCELDLTPQAPKYTSEDLWTQRKIIHIEAEVYTNALRMAERL